MDYAERVARQAIIIALLKQRLASAEAEMDEIFSLTKEPDQHEPSYICTR